MKAYMDWAKLSLYRYYVGARRRRPLLYLVAGCFWAIALLLLTYWIWTPYGSAYHAPRSLVWSWLVSALLLCILAAHLVSRWLYLLMIKHVRANLLEHGLLALVLDPAAEERLPALQLPVPFWKRLVLPPPPLPDSLMERLRSFICRYGDCCYALNLWYAPRPVAILRYWTGLCLQASAVVYLGGEILGGLLSEDLIRLLMPFYLVSAIIFHGAVGLVLIYDEIERSSLITVLAQELIRDDIDELPQWGR